MIVDVSAAKIRFGDVPEGGYFWYNGRLHLKPRVSGVLKREDTFFAVVFGDNTLTTFSNQEVQVIPETSKLKITKV